MNAVYCCTHAGVELARYVIEREGPTRQTEPTVSKGSLSFTHGWHFVCAGGGRSRLQYPTTDSPENVPSCDVCAVNLCAEVARHDGVASVVYDDLPPSRPMSVWTLSCWRQSCMS